ncbi:hypothetical protein ACFSKU_17800 [Pontibacter silvestris]|uniref:GLPGLI family protein n=1 Tax=Pontibacter silvestris TaxID=2305183 RepID=A0ABW4X1B3_9BACT|nr:hypothetical protein [Pontibacter silvestris]MCC9135880.1 hypothetical protein [Pontibacter silvestris]
MKTLILKAAMSLLTVGACYTSSSAQIAIKDETGRPLMTKQYTDVKGSPYLADEWYKGTVELTNGTIYDEMNLMYDQVKDELIFKAAGEQAQAFEASSVYAFTIHLQKDGLPEEKKNYRKGFIPVDGAPDMAFYEVLADGQTQLLKRTKKVVFEEIPYGSSTKVKDIRESSYYYIARSGKLVKIKADKKSVLKALKDQAPALEKYAKANKLNLKDDAGLAQLVAYYNGL